MFLFAACDPVTYDTFGEIAGVVVDFETGENLSGVRVDLSPIAKSVVTGSDGQFHFSNLEEKDGKYTIWYRKDGYDPDHKDIEVIGGETITVTITMKKK